MLSQPIFVSLFFAQNSTTTAGKLFFPYANLLMLKSFSSQIASNPNFCKRLGDDR
jgi:hypothetical protein